MKNAILLAALPTPERFRELVTEVIEERVREAIERQLGIDQGWDIDTMVREAIKKEKVGQ